MSTYDTNISWTDVLEIWPFVVYNHWQQLYLCVDTSMYVYMCVCIQVHLYISMHAYKYVYVGTYVFAVVAAPSSPKNHLLQYVPTVFGCIVHRLTLH